MVRVLIQMRAAMIAHRRSTRFGTVSLLALALVGLMSALSTLWLGFAHYPTPAAGSDVVAVVMAVWVIGRVAYTAFNTGSPLRLEIFRLLPIPRSDLGRALLVVGLLDPVVLFMAVAFAALVALGAQHGVGPAVVGAVGAALTLLLTGVAVSVVEAALPAGSHRRQDAGTVIVAVLISLVAVAGTLLPSVIAALTSETIPALSVVVRILPSGWAADAVNGAVSGSVLVVLIPLAALIALVVVLVRIWPMLLSRRLDGTLGSSRRNRWRGTRRSPLPQTPTGAVIAKEVRMWWRDPLRLTFLLIATIVGLGVCVVPEITHGTNLLLPFCRGAHGRDRRCGRLQPVRVRRVVDALDRDGARQRTGRRPRSAGRTVDLGRSVRPVSDGRVHPHQRASLGVAVGTRITGGGARRRRRLAQWRP